MIFASLFITPCLECEEQFGRIFDYTLFMAWRSLPEQNVHMDVFATKLRERAAQLGISNAEVARRAGLSERRYGHYVSGVREPDLRTLLTIAATLGTTPDALLGVTDPRPPSLRQGVQDRILSALAALPVDDLQTLAIQIEALASARAPMS